jgi:hypothetical protein
MKLFKAIAALLLLVGAFFVGRAALNQFGYFQEYGTEFTLPFHLFNISVLTLIMVALVALAAVALSIDEEIEEPRISPSEYLKAVLFGTAGVITMGISWFEGEAERGNIYPYVKHVYHSGDGFAVTIVGLALLVIALHYLTRHYFFANYDPRPIQSQAANTADGPATADRETKDDPGSGPDLSVIIIDHAIPAEEAPACEAEVDGNYDLEGGGKLHFGITVTGETADEVASTAQSLLETVLQEDS